MNISTVIHQKIHTSIDDFETYLVCFIDQKFIINDELLIYLLKSKQNIEIYFWINIVDDDENDENRLNKIIIREYKRSNVNNQYFVLTIIKF